MLIADPFGTDVFIKPEVLAKRLRPLAFEKNRIKWRFKRK